MTDLKPQRRSTKVAMSPEERDAFLTEQRVCRVATVGGDGEPHVAPLWFAWDGDHLWLTSLTRSQRYVDLQRDPRISVVVDAGVDYHELHGVQVTGTAEVVGPSPVPAGPSHEPEVAHAADLIGKKYFHNGLYANDGWHGWLRVTPTKIVSWDFRKNASLTSVNPR
jgi:PPOX class probable F420-dependent enzyme